MSGIFNTTDLQEMARNHYVFKQDEERKWLEKFACDPLFHTICQYAETHAISIRQLMKDELLQGRTKIPFWSCKETNYFREAGAIHDSRSDPSSVNPEITVEEYINGRNLDYWITVAENGTYKVGNTIRLTNCLLLLANYYGPNFSCSYKRRRFETAEQYHVYEIEIWLEWHRTERSGSVKDEVEKAVAAYNARNPEPVISENPEIACDYCGNYYNTEGFGSYKEYCSQICYRRDSGVCDY